MLIGYTGVLLSATSNPLWSKNPWLGPMFTASAVSSGAAAIQLALHAGGCEPDCPSIRVLDKVDTVAHATETVCMAGFIRHAGEKARPITRGRQANHYWLGGAAMAASEVLKRLPLKSRKARRLAHVASAALSLAAGFHASGPWCTADGRRRETPASRAATGTRTKALPAAAPKHSAGIVKSSGTRTAPPPPPQSETRMALLSFLDKEHSVAGPGYSRWLVPPAALAIHLSIGQAYAFSVFKIPLTPGHRRRPRRAGDWTFEQLGWIFCIAIVFLGISAAVFGSWLERRRPAQGDVRLRLLLRRRASSSRPLGVKTHQLWLIYLGYGVLGGIGLGLGYISPVSTLIKWFLDRPGMATGMAIMGFGGGAMIGAPLSNILMTHFKTAHAASASPRRSSRWACSTSAS